MPWYVVGIDGDRSPDPEYWRARWDLIEADRSHQARTIWIEMREGWLSPDEHRHIFVDRVKAPEEYTYFDRYSHDRNAPNNCKDCPKDPITKNAPCDNGYRCEHLPV